MTDDTNSEDIAAGAMGMLLSNPMMRLTTIAQAAANLAQVAKTAHEIGYDLDAHAAATSSADLARKATSALRLRDAALDRVVSLLATIRDQ